ncbi:hypothetical protein FAZ95_17460 [Trinickia violacea]|uniref:Uncharacterized protein n=1 Tax=Trinickia violacea TaxID=2571746 RepID=A0A4P8IXD3_9BURK|nr:hypothetical protein [Trinickia violacea]QCP51834.1 hypothetical protein FAZ95_17460 [Trinickia violacea]
MTQGSAVPASFEALPNPRGAAVRAAETALIDAQRGFSAHADITAPLIHAAAALRQAGWHAAQRFADTLVLASPFAGGDFARRFGIALYDFQAAIERRNLRELACSATLFDHYRELSVRLAQHTHAFEVAYEDLALAHRPIPPATLRAVPAQRLALLRASYEAALLFILRGHSAAQSALDEIEACMAELAGPDPYDVWRLAAGCSKALRASGRAESGAGDAKRFYARCNLLLADQARGIAMAPRSFVRASLAILWRDYALYGAAAEDADQVALLNDYGLTVDWHVAGTQASEALWEAGAAAAEQQATGHVSLTRELGVLSVNANAYEDFLQTADASIDVLSKHASTAKDDAGGALLASDAAYRLGAAACALGLGHVALLSDALGLAWRRRAHAGAAAPEVHSRAVIDAPDGASISRATEALRAMLLRVAAGVAPPDSQQAVAALTQAIERGREGPSASHATR